MKGISDFLKKYLDFTPPGRLKAQAVAQAITERFNHPLEVEQVLVRGSRVFVQTSSALKSEIVMHKTQIIERAKELGSGEIEELS